MSNRSLASLLALFGAVAATGAGSRAMAADRGPTPSYPPEAEQPLAALQDVDVVEHLGDKVPGGLTFHDPEGHKVELDAMLGQKPLLVTLGYYKCPMLCDLVLDGLVKAMKQSGLAPGKDFQAVSISIDPKEEAKQALTTRARVWAGFGAGANASTWPFLLGDGFASRVLADAVGFKYAYDKTSGQFAHEAVSFVLTPDGRISRYLYGVDVIPRDFRLALVEAGAGRVGTSFDRLLLSCFQYDPVNRKYAPYALGFVRIGAGLVFLMLATLLAVLWRKELVMRRRRVA
ncbi:MAG TPA: SCO family protein [Polyangia bacterium]|jgi:protein SCO1/2